MFWESPSRGYSQVVVDVKTGEKVELDDEYTAWVQEEIKTYYAKQLEKADNYNIETAVGFPHREILRISTECATGPGRHGWQYRR